jgi:hypothetical protein
VKPSDAPAFLEGTFLWQENGYFFGAPPPVPLRDPTLLEGRDPWLALAATLEYAKAGSHDAVGELARWFGEDVELGFIQSCLFLIGDAGRAEHMRLLVEMMKPEKEEYLRIKACDAACHAGYLWLGHEVLKVWRSIRVAEKSIISLHLSNLLDPPGSAEVYDYLAFEEDDEYLAFVQGRLEALARTTGDGEAAVFQGVVLDVRKLAEQMRDLLRPTTPAQKREATFRQLRHRFEAATGTDCRSFYRDDELQPLAAAAVIEDFLESEAATRFVPGKRYFFGHPVP